MEKRLRQTSPRERVKTKKYRILFIVTSFIFLLTGGVTFVLLKPSKPELINKPIESYKSPTPQPTFFKKLTTTDDTTSWETYTDNTFNLTLKLPSEVIIDPRQTIKDKRIAFIFKDDAKKMLPKNIPTLFLVDTKQKNVDGLTAYKYIDCKKPCEINANTIKWVNINDQALGIINPAKEDIANYFVTDKMMNGTLINLYIGNIQKPLDATLTKKVTRLEEVIKTIQFNR